MPRRKSGGVMLPWLSAKADCKEGRFLQIGNSIMLSKSFQNLSFGAQMMYFCMALESGGRIDFQFPHSAVLKYGFNKNYGAKYIKELCGAGFVELVNSGKTVREANEYKFSLKWKINQ